MLSDFLVPTIQRAMIAGGIVGLVCSVIGVFVVLRGLAFISAGISHSAFAGVAFGLLFGINPFISALVFCSVIGLLIGKVSDLGNLKEDTSIGIFLAASMAVGVIAMSFVKSSQIDIIGYLFGNILSLSADNLKLSLAIGITVLIILFIFLKEFMLSSFDPDQAVISGIPAKVLTYILLVLLSAVTVVSIKVVGIILGTALIVAPAATALQFSRDFDRALLLSGCIGVAVTEIGIILSVLLNSAPGATITLVATVVFFTAVTIKHLHKRSLRMA